MRVSLVLSLLLPVQGVILSKKEDRIRMSPSEPLIIEEEVERIKISPPEPLVIEEEVERIRISPPEPSVMMVRSGSNVTLSCQASHPWFLCLWVHPSGGKLCSIQEEGEHSQVCQGMQGAELIAGQRDCQVRLTEVSQEDSGDWLCLLSQAGVFHTDRAVTSLTVATPARPILSSPGQLYHSEPVNLSCQTDSSADPQPLFQWALLDSDGQETVISSRTANSSLTFTPSLSDNGGRLVCYTHQLDPHTNQVLYLHNNSVNLSVTARPSPLQALLSDQQDVVAGVGISCFLIIFCVILVIIFTVRSKSSLPPKSSNMIGGQDSYIIFISEEPGTSDRSSQDKESGIDVSHGDFVSFSSSDLYSNTTTTNNRSSSLTSHKTNSEADQDQSIDEAGGSEGGLSNISVFECQHGCFGHDHNHSQYQDHNEHHHHHSHHQQQQPHRVDSHYLRDNVLNTDL